ncbi:MAG: hypothetical protein KBT66_10840 [Amphritea sp.]|nr:hypothetical protein [Amphritea sp.]
MSINSGFINNHNRQSGYILVTGLLFLLVITLVGVTSMNLSTVDYKISSNTAFHVDAFENAESARQTAGSELLFEYIKNRGWTGIGFSVPTGVVVDDDTRDLFMGNEETVAELRDGIYGDISVLTTDLQFALDGNGDGDTNDGVDAVANIMVIKTDTRAAEGSNTAQLSGYEGDGKGAAGGGFYNFFMLMSQGTSAANASATTSTDYRYVN